MRAIHRRRVFSLIGALIVLFSAVKAQVPDSEKPVFQIVDVIDEGLLDLDLVGDDHWRGCLDLSDDDARRREYLNRYGDPDRSN